MTDSDVIANYESLIAKEDQDGVVHFDWKASKQDPFYLDTIELLKDYFKKEMKRRNCSLKAAMKAPPERWVEITFL